MPANENTPCEGGRDLGFALSRKLVALSWLAVRLGLLFALAVFVRLAFAFVLGT